MSVPNHTTCPSDETLAAFIDGRLDAEARKRVVEHMANCEVCYAIFTDASEAGRAVMGPSPQVESSRFTIKRRVTIALAALAVAAGLLVVAREPIDRWLERRDRIPSLMSAARALEHRPVEGRLSGGYQHRPLPDDYRRPNEDVVDPRNVDLYRAASLAVKEAERNGTVSNLHAAALGYLLLRKNDKAVELFERALIKSTGRLSVADAIENERNVQLLVDASSAFMLRGRQDAETLALAISAAGKAATLNPASAEANFNLALSLEHAGFHERAISAWKRYLEIDSTSAWASEARGHLSALQDEPVAIELSSETEISALPEPVLSGRLKLVSLQSARIYAEEVALPAWAQSVGRGSSAGIASMALSVADQIGRHLSRTNHDHSVADSVLAIKSALGKGDTRALRSLRVGHSAYGEGRLAFQKASDEAAFSILSDAGRALADGGSPLSYRATMYAATVAHYNGRHDQALDAVRDSLTKMGSTTVRYPTIVGQLEWIQATVLLAKGRPSDALDASRRALVQFEAAEEPSNIVGVETMIADANGRMGDYQESWRWMLSALAKSSSATHRRRYLAVTNALRESIGRGCFTLSDQLASWADDLAQKSGNAHERAETGRLYAMSLQARGDPAGAEKIASDALAIVRTAVPSGSRRRLEADIILVHAASLIQTDPARALPEIIEAQREFTALNNIPRVARADFYIGSTHLRLGHIQEAIKHLRLGMVETSVASQSLDDEELRATLNETGRPLVDALVDAYITSKDPVQAWNVSDSFKRATAGVGSRDPEMAAEFAQLPPGITLLAYHSLPKELIIWTASSAGVRFTRRSIPRERLEALVEDASASLQDSASQSAEDLASRLYDELIAPIEGYIQPADRLLVVPDGFLHRVSFPALRNRRMGRFLIESHSVSTSLFRPTPSTATARDHFMSPSVVAAGPVGEGSSITLSGAGREARDIARILDTDVLLTGPNATPELFLRSGREARLIHFGGHARANQSRPGYAALLMAPDRSHPDGTLYAHEFAATSLINHPLVVLAGCATADGPSRSGGTSSVASAALAAGASSVVATLWPIRDGSSPPFFREFYLAIERGATPEAALRHTQMTMMQTPVCPISCWGAFGLHIAALDADWER